MDVGFRGCHRVSFIHVCRVHRLALCVFLNHFLFYLLRQHISLNLMLLYRISWTRSLFQRAFITVSQSSPLQVSHYASLAFIWVLRVSVLAFMLGRQRLSALSHHPIKIYFFNFFSFWLLFLTAIDNLLLRYNCSVIICWKYFLSWRCPSSFFLPFLTFVIIDFQLINIGVLTCCISRLDWFTSP